jgi:glycosyltransferase involved in cell wall biosynthesis
MSVSIVITCYNYGKYLKGCLESVQAQTYSDFEAIVVDDGSTDDTADVIRPFLADSRIRYHYQKNQGQTVAKNVGISLCTRDIVAFLDADDQWMPEKLARQVPLFANPAVGVTFTSYHQIGEDDQEVPYEGPQGYLALRRGQTTRWLGFDNFVPFSSSAIRRSLLEKHGAFDEKLRMGIDWDIWLRMSCVTEFDFVPDVLMAYRVGHANQMSKNKEGRFAAADFIFQRFLEQHPDALTPQDLREIEFYTACTRAAAYRHWNLTRSTGLLCKAWTIDPLSSSPYLGLLRNAQAIVARVASLL